MMQTWTISEAKARFSELVSLVSRGEPQRVTRNGQSVCLMVSPQTYSAPTQLVAPRLFRQRPEALALDDADIDRLFLGGSDLAATPRLGPEAPRLAIASNGAPALDEAAPVEHSGEGAGR